MRKSYLIYLQIFALIMLIVLSLILIPNNAKISAKSLNDCTHYRYGWTLSTASTSQKCNVLPDFLDTQNESDVYITRFLNDVEDGDCIGFFSFEQQVHVYLDGKEIYTFVPDEKMNSITPGNRWNFIPLRDHYNGSLISIQIHQCYSSNRISIPTLYYGTQAGIILNYLRKEIVQLLASFLMILFGIAISTFCILSKKKTILERGLTWLALFAIFRGFWTAIEANVYSFFFTRYLLFSRVSYLCLKLAVVTYVQFINVYFYRGRNKAFKILVGLSCADFWFTSFCQMILKIDFANTVFITHIILLVAAAVSLTNNIISLYDISRTYNSVKDKRQLNSYIAQSLCTFAIIFTSIIDLVRYYTVNSPDISRYSRWGDLIYVATLSVIIFLDFIGLISMGKEAKQIKEEASLDPLTKLMNRFSFERAIADGNKHTWIHQSIVVLDLNNLKYFNDVHGHGMGDYYIIIASEIIKDAFLEWGNAYRIGGDEFCVIAQNFTLEKFNETRLSIEQYMNNLKMPNNDLHMAISAGYAAFDPNLDQNLKDTMKRADEAMYARKTELKSNEKVPH